jgi:hypothetical protein
MMIVDSSSRGASPCEPRRMARDIEQPSPFEARKKERAPQGDGF